MHDSVFTQYLPGGVIGESQLSKSIPFVVQKVLLCTAVNYIFHYNEVRDFYMWKRTEVMRQNMEQVFHTQKDFLFVIKPKEDA
jgi:hypothetical protein